MKNKYKPIVTIMVVLFLIIGGITAATAQKQNEPKTCNFFPKIQDCLPGGIGNCICMVVDP